MHGVRRILRGIIIGAGSRKGRALRVKPWLFSNLLNATLHKGHASVKLDIHFLSGSQIHPLHALETPVKFTQTC